MSVVCLKKSLSLVIIVLLSMSKCYSSGNLYLGLSLGRSSATEGHREPHISYFSGATITDAYPLNHRSSSAMMLSVNGGYEWSGHALRPAVAFGLGFYTNPDDFSYTGHLIETPQGEASMRLYRYQYHVSTSRVMAEMQLAWMLSHHVLPFVNLGVGPSWNQLRDYHEFAVTPDGYPPLPPFHNQSNVAFAYQVGVGLMKAFNLTHQPTGNLHDRVSLGFRYANLNATVFGTRGNVYPFALNMGRLSTHDIYLSYTHLF